MAGPWRAEPHAPYDKQIEIVGPGTLRLTLDNDDVNPADVEAGLPKIVAALNDQDWSGFDEDWRGF